MSDEENFCSDFITELLCIELSTDSTRGRYYAITERNTILENFMGESKMLSFFFVEQKT